MARRQDVSLDDDVTGAFAQPFLDTIQGRTTKKVEEYERLIKESAVEPADSARDVDDEE